MLWLGSLLAAISDRTTSSRTQRSSPSRSALATGGSMVDTTLSSWASPVPSRSPPTRGSPVMDSRPAPAAAAAARATSTSPSLTGSDVGAGTATSPISVPQDGARVSSTLRPAGGGGGGGLDIESAVEEHGDLVSSATLWTTTWSICAALSPEPTVFAVVRCGAMCGWRGSSSCVWTR